MHMKASSDFNVLTHRDLDKNWPFQKQNFHMFSLLNFIKIRFYASYGTGDGIPSFTGSGNGLVPNRHQTITWISDDYWFITWYSITSIECTVPTPMSSWPLLCLFLGNPQHYLWSYFMSFLMINQGSTFTTKSQHIAVNAGTMNHPGISDHTMVVSGHTDNNYIMVACMDIYSDLCVYTLTKNTRWYTVNYIWTSTNYPQLSFNFASLLDPVETHRYA